MATTSNDLTTLDFALVKENLKAYLKSQPIFKDYDFEASNINVLLDVLAYNTNLNSFYLNMVANEMFLDSALMRDSIISHAKELNYIPRSFRSAQATVNIKLIDTSTEAAITIPRGTSFTGTIGQKNFTFTTAENILAGSTDTANEFLASNVILYEGDYVQDSYVTNADSQPRFIITNKTVDTNSLRVTVIEDNGENVLSYERKDTLFGIGALDQVFFIQPSENDTYEVIFGDDVIGRTPKNGSIVLLEYRTCNGELPNGIRNFSADGNIGTATVDDISVVEEDGEPLIASGGSLPESIESIKFNAPRAFTTQERVVTAQDYATLLKANFSEINDVSAYGGEEFNPPQYGRVIVAVDLKNTDVLPQRYRQKYSEYLKPRSPLSLQPVFVRPEYSYLSVDTRVKYNINQTSLGIADMESLVLSAIQNYNFNNLEGFNKTMHYSKLIAAIDAAQTSIVSNDTRVLVTKYISINPEAPTNYDIDFDMPIINDIGQKPKGGHPKNQISAVTTDTFIYDGEEVFIEDNGVGILNLVRDEGDQHTIITEIGGVNYDRGIINIGNLRLNTKATLKFMVRPREADIIANRRTILRVLDSDIKINVEQVRI